MHSCNTGFCYKFTDIPKHFSIFRAVCNIFFFCGCCFYSPPAGSKVNYICNKNTDKQKSTSLIPHVQVAFEGRLAKLYGLASSVGGACFQAGKECKHKPETKKLARFFT